MNAQKLLALVAALGVTAAGVVVYVARPGTKVADFVDAGIAACPVVEVICPGVRAGVPGSIRARLRDCRAGGMGFIARPLPADVELIAIERCRKAPAEVLAAEGDTADEPFDCACSSGSSCTVTSPTTGLPIAAPLGVTLGPGYAFSSFSGAGCVPKACVALAGPGDNSWPVGCP